MVVQSNRSGCMVVQLKSSGSKHRLLQMHAFCIEVHTLNSSTILLFTLSIVHSLCHSICSTSQTSMRRIPMYRTQVSQAMNAVAGQPRYTMFILDDRTENYLDETMSTSTIPLSHQPNVYLPMHAPYKHLYILLYLQSFIYNVLHKARSCMCDL